MGDSGMTHDCYSIQRMRELMQQNWPQALTPSSDLLVAVARLRDLLFENDRPTIIRNGLTTAEFDALVALRKLPPPHQLTPTSLRRAMLITSGGLTKVLHQLQAKGLVRRMDDGLDRRIKHVQLTPHGVSLAEKTLYEVLDVDSRLLDQVVPRNELVRLNQLLQTLLNGIEALVRR